MIKGILRCLSARQAQGPSLPETDNRQERSMFPEKDRQALFERRAFRVMNRDPQQAAVMVRKLTILAEGRR